jgi:hypothetical protein
MPWAKSTVPFKPTTNGKFMITAFIQFPVILAILAQQSHLPYTSKVRTTACLGFLVYVVYAHHDQSSSCPCTQARNGLCPSLHRYTRLRYIGKLGWGQRHRNKEKRSFHASWNMWIPLIKSEIMLTLEISGYGRQWARVWPRPHCVQKLSQQDCKRQFFFVYGTHMWVRLWWSCVDGGLSIGIDARDIYTRASPKASSADVARIASRFWVENATNWAQVQRIQRQQASRPSQLRRSTIYTI